MANLASLTVPDFTDPALTALDVTQPAESSALVSATHRAGRTIIKANDEALKARIDSLNAFLNGDFETWTANVRAAINGSLDRTLANPSGSVAQRFAFLTHILQGLSATDKQTVNSAIGSPPTTLSSSSTPTSAISTATLAEDYTNFRQIEIILTINVGDSRVVLEWAVVPIRLTKEALEMLDTTTTLGGSTVALFASWLGRENDTRTNALGMTVPSTTSFRFFPENGMRYTVSKILGIDRIAGAS